MEQPPEEKKPEKKKLPFRQRLREAFNGVSRREIVGAIRYTLSDLRKPREIALLLGCSVVPGGWIGYGVYRIAKYRRHKAANDNGKPPGKSIRRDPGGPRM